MAISARTDASFSLAEARKIVADLFEPNPVIYWTDLLASLIVGSVCYGLVQTYPLGSFPQIALFVVACLAFYRLASMSHELVHLRTGHFTAFRVVWNLVCGIPFLMPSFTYYTHLDHHRRKFYGTENDGEYLSLGTGSPLAILVYLSQVFIIPIVAVIRFLVLSPLCWISPRLRAVVQQRASSMVMDPSYVRPLPTADVMRVWRLQEVACFLFTLAVTVMLIRGRLPMSFLLQAYLTGVFILMINAVRTLGAHRFLNDGHQEMTFVEQLVDSVNYPRWPLVSAIWAPIGLRFHALHHLFPSMPYHTLAAGNKRLVAQLPADSPYRLTQSNGLLESLWQLWSAASQAAQHEAAIAHESFAMQETRSGNALSGNSASGTSAAMRQ